MVSLCSSAFAGAVGVRRGARGQAPLRLQPLPSPESAFGLCGGTWPPSTDGLQEVICKAVAQDGSSGCLGRVGNGGPGRGRGMLPPPRIQWGGGLDLRGSFCWPKPCRGEVQARTWTEWGRLEAAILLFLSVFHPPRHHVFPLAGGKEPSTPMPGSVPWDGFAVWFPELPPASAPALHGSPPPWDPPPARKPLQNAFGKE